MKPMSIIGIVLIVFGLVGLVYGGINYTSNRQVVDMGSMHVQVNEHRQLPLSPIAGAVAVAAGVTLLIVDRRRPTHGRIE